MRIKKSHILGALVVLTILFAYVPALKSGYVWDDNVYVTNNHTLRTAEGLGRIWTEPGANIQYYPLVFTSFWMEYHLWGLHPFGYHLVNVVLHLFNVLLVWLILRRLGVRWAGLAAAVFALHPVQVESVAWITERKNLLSGAFYLAAVLVYLRFSGLGESDSAGSDRARSGRSWGLYALVAFLFVLALLSKTVAATLPVTLLVITWWKRGTLEWTDVLPLVPLFVLGVAMGSLTVYLEKTQVGASGHEWGLSMIDRSIVAGTAVWFYLGKLLLPIKLIFSYPRWAIDADVWWQYVLPAAAVAAMVLLYQKRERFGRGPFAAMVFFVITLAPALGFFDIYPMRYTYVADHYQYLASIGPLALFSAMLASAAGKQATTSEQPTPPALRRLGIGALAALVLALAAATWKQSTIYRNEETLWTATIAKNPGSWMAYNNLGLYYLRQREPERAVPYLRRSVSINPNAAEVHYNLGLALWRLGFDGEAEAHFEEASRLQPGIGGGRPPGWN